MRKPIMIARPTPNQRTIGAAISAPSIEPIPPTPTVIPIRIVERCRTLIA